jgi:tetratricopeptide (TPR) repeat protein
MTDELARTTPHNLGLYRLEGFAGRRAQLLQLHEWMTGGDDLPAIAISGDQGIGKSALATAAAWNNFHHFEDGIVRVGAAGLNRFRLYDIVRTLDTVYGTTLTRVSEDRWGISILEQLYKRKRLLVLDELSDATSDEIGTIVDIIAHLNEAAGNSRIMLISREFHPAIASLVQFQHIHLQGLLPEALPQFIRNRAPEGVCETALQRVDELYALTQGRPYALRLALGLMLDYAWDDLWALLGSVADADGALAAEDLAAFAVENFASIHPEAGPLLNRLVSAAGGASLAAMRELFWAGLGTPTQLGVTLMALQDRALIDHDAYNQRIVMHPFVRNYVEQNVILLGEEWDRRHARYYVKLVEKYQYLPVDRWPEVDTEWGNTYRGADWCAERIDRLWQASALELISEPEIDQAGLELPSEAQEYVGDLQVARDYALALAHYAFWRHPPGTLRWLSTGATAALALGDDRNYAWLLMNIGRHLFFLSRVEEAIEWLKRAAAILDARDLLNELAYTYTDLGTSCRIIDQPRQALAYFRAAFACVVQLGDQYGIATTHMNLGSAFYGLQDYDQALLEYRQALRISMRMDNVQQAASVFNSMGLAMEGMDQLEEAEKGYLQALEYFRRIDDVTGITTCYNNLGSVSFAQGDYDAALEWYELDQKLSERRGAWTDMAATLHNLGHVALEQAAYDRAYAYFSQSRNLYAAFQLLDYMREEEDMLKYIRSVAPDVARSEDET